MLNRMTITTGGDGWRHRTSFVSAVGDEYPPVWWLEAQSDYPLSIKRTYTIQLADGFWIVDGAATHSATRLAGPFETLEAAKAAHTLIISCR